MSAEGARSCAACLGRTSAQPFVADDYSLGLARGSWRYYRCLACGSAVLDPQPDDATLEAAYGSSYAPYVAAQGRAGPLIERLARSEAESLVALAEPDTPLIDLGCGTGRFLERLRRAGWRGPMSGLELSPYVAAETAGRLGIDVRTGAVEGAELGESVFGVIVLRHVIEHVRDPQAVLATVVRALAPGGLVYVATPDASSLAAHVFGRYWHGYDPPRHLYAFTSAGTRALLDRVGLALVAERWDFAPQMWSGSLRYAIDPGRTHPGRRRLAGDLNPLVAGPAVLAGSVEWLLRRTTMYGATARRPTS